MNPQLFHRGKARVNFSILFEKLTLDIFLSFLINTQIFYFTNVPWVENTSLPIGIVEQRALHGLNFKKRKIRNNIILACNA